MKKGLICYFSLTGNTLLACKYIVSKIQSMPFDFHDMSKEDLPDFNKYSFVGFATYSDEFSIAKYLKKYMSKMPVSSAYAFVFSTFGRDNGSTTKVLEKYVKNKGFTVIANHALHTPENYPPVIRMFSGYENSPSIDELSQFEAFIKDLDNICYRIQNNEKIEAKSVELPLKHKLMPDFSNKYLMQFVMGKKEIDQDRCIKCGLCEKKCPYDVIHLREYPEFNESKCHGCFLCYNVCPTKAIFTKKYKDFGHYPCPSDKLKNKLKVNS